MVKSEKIEKLDDDNNNSNKIEKTYGSILKSLEDISKKQKNLEHKLKEAALKNKILNNQKILNQVLPIGL